MYQYYYHDDDDDDDNDDDAVPGMRGARLLGISGRDFELEPCTLTIISHAGSVRRQYNVCHACEITGDPTLHLSTSP